MPLTPAHTAAAWPIIRLVPSLPLDALIIGTMVPDFEYFLELAPRGRFGHSPLGLLVFCLPVGIVTWKIFRHVVRPAGLTLVPAGLRHNLVARETGLAPVLLAILLGAASHSFWDSFTHARGWGVHQLPALTMAVNLQGMGYVPVFKLLQHGSTILGLATVAGWAWSWLRRQPRNTRVYSGDAASRTLRVVTLLLAVAAGGAFLNGLRGMNRGLAAGLGHAAVGGMAALAVACLVFGLLARTPKDPGATS